MWLTHYAKYDIPTWSDDDSDADSDTDVVVEVPLKDIYLPGGGRMRYGITSTRCFCHFLYSTTSLSLVLTMIQICGASLSVVSTLSRIQTLRYVSGTYLPWWRENRMWDCIHVELLSVYEKIHVGQASGVCEDGQDFEHLPRFFPSTYDVTESGFNLELDSKLDLPPDAALSLMCNVTATFPSFPPPPLFFFLFVFSLLSLPLCLSSSLFPLSI